MATFRSTFKELLPSWLLEGDGEHVVFALATVLDLFMDRVEQSLYARFPSHAPPDALAHIGRDRRIIRGFNEPRETYATRLIGWLDAAKRWGSAGGVIEQLWGYVAPFRVRMRIVSDNETRSLWKSLPENTTANPAAAVTKTVVTPSDWNFDGPHVPILKYRFWTIIYPLSVDPPLFETRGTWDDNDDGVTTWDEMGGTWDTTATADQVGSIKQIVNERMGGHNVSNKILICFDNDKFDPGIVSGMPDGTWGRWGKLSGSDLIPARPQDVSFWTGE